MPPKLGVVTKVYQGKGPQAFGNGELLADFHFLGVHHAGAPAGKAQYGLPRRQRPVARLEDADASVAQGIVDQDVLLDDRPAVFQQGQARTKLLWRAGFVEADREIVAADCKRQAQPLAAVAQVDLLHALALRDVYETVESENGPDQPADQQQNDAQVHGIDPPAGPAPVFTIKKKNALAGLNLQRSCFSGHERPVKALQGLQRALVFELQPVGKVLKPGGLKARSANEQQIALLGDPIRRTDDDVGGEHQNQHLEPPGVIHVEEAQDRKKTKKRLSKSSQVRRRLAVLRNEGADDGRRRQRKQQNNGQSYRCEKVPDSVEKTVGCGWRGHVKKTIGSQLLM